jgi:hypothetical protein
LYPFGRWKFAECHKAGSNDTFSFVFAPEEPLQWKAGQLLRYVINHPDPDDRGGERFSQSHHARSIYRTPRISGVIRLSFANSRNFVYRLN